MSNAKQGREGAPHYYEIVINDKLVQVCREDGVFDGYEGCRVSSPQILNSTAFAYGRDPAQAHQNFIRRIEGLVDSGSLTI
jgi:hypothetical protein